MTTDIDYIETEEDGLDSIKPLWEHFNEHHRMHSKYFAKKYQSFTFEDRKEMLMKKAGKGNIHVGIAVNLNTCRPIGFCISSITRYMEGEVEYLFIEEEFRSQGIGENLLKKALTWLGNHGSAITKIAVEVGNEEVQPFYTKYGFVPRFIILEEAP